MDERFHWHACADCEEQLDKAEHDLVWTEKTAPALGLAGEEEGVCSVCGYKATRPIPALEPEEQEPSSLISRFDGSLGISPNAFRIFVLGVFGAMGVGLIALFIGAIVKGSKRRR